MNTITTEQQAAIAARLKDMTLPVGLGTEESACSIAAINLALTGELTDDIPECMSEVIGKWIIQAQDTMPSEMRNSARWKSLLPRAAGTGRGMERERLNIIMDWMWGTALPTLQPIADRNGFGDAWSYMTTRRTEAAARAAADAAYAAKAFAAEKAATYAANAAWWAAGSAADAAADAADAVKWAAGSAAKAAAAGAKAAANAAARVATYAAKADTDAWITFDPCDLLDRLIRVGEQK